MGADGAATNVHAGSRRLSRSRRAAAALATAAGPVFDETTGAVLPSWAVAARMASKTSTGRTFIGDKHPSVARATILLALPVVGLILFFSFPVVSSYAFRAFDCECFEDGRSYLRADYSLMCSTDCRLPSQPMLFETEETGVYTDEYWRHPATSSQK